MWGSNQVSSSTSNSPYSCSDHFDSNHWTWFNCFVASYGHVSSAFFDLETVIRGFRGGGRGPPFLLHFQNVFETSTLLYCCMTWKVKFSFGAEGEGGGLGPLSLNFLDPPLQLIMTWWDQNKFIWFAGWEVRKVKNRSPRSKFSLNGATISRQIACLFFSLAVNWFHRSQMGLFMKLLGFWTLCFYFP